MNKLLIKNQNLKKKQKSNIEEEKVELEELIKNLMIEVKIYVKCKNISEK